MMAIATKHTTYNDVMSLVKKYYDAGFTPLPLKPNSKEAAISWKDWQGRRPSWGEVEKVFNDAIAKYGDSINIGLLCGRVHNLVVLDIDDPKKFEVAQKNMDLKIPTTPFVKTRKGYHCYFRYPKGYEVRRHERLSDWGAEIRGDGCYVVAPPSVVNGHTYHFISRNGKPCDLSVLLADVPTELLQAFGVMPTKGQTFASIQPQQTMTFANNGSLLTSEIIAATEALLVRSWTEGIRHDLSLYLAGWLAKEGYPYDDVVALISAIADKAGDNEIKDRWRAIKDTYEKAAKGDEVKGWMGLTEILDAYLLQSLRGLLVRKSQPTSSEFDRPEKPTTDLGNAERLVRLFGDRIKYVPTLGWFVWDGKRWCRDKGNAMVMKFAEETVKTIYKEAAEVTAPAERAKLAKWAMASENKQRIQAMIDLAAPLCRADADEFDRDPYLLNCNNGVVNLRTGELLPHDPDLQLTKLCPVDYDPDADAPTWLKFLNDIFLGDTDLIAYVQRALGYSITGDVCEDVFFICWGSGANGKSTLFQTLIKVLGDYAKMVAPDALLKRNQQSDSHPTAIADLFGVRFAVAQETDEGKHLATARVKVLTGKDRIKARFMHKDHFEFDPTHKIWLSTNHKPIVSDTTYAMWRRIHLIPFRAVFDESRRDKHMLEKLLAEKEGILAWLVKGCLEWQRQGLNPPTIVRDATKEYQTEMDKVQAWLEACCIVDPKAVTPFSDLYASYEQWCKENDEEPIGKRAFGNKLTEKGFPSDTIKLGGKATKVRKGIMLKDNDDGNGLSNGDSNETGYRVTEVTDVLINSPIYEALAEKCQNYGNHGNSVTAPSPPTNSDGFAHDGEVCDDYDKFRKIFREPVHTGENLQNSSQSSQHHNPPPQSSTVNFDTGSDGRLFDGGSKGDSHGFTHETVVSTNSPAHTGSDEKYANKSDTSNMMTENDDLEPTNLPINKLINECIANSLTLSNLSDLTKLGNSLRQSDNLTNTEARPKAEFGTNSLTIHHDVVEHNATPNIADQLSSTNLEPLHFKPDRCPYCGDIVEWSRDNGQCWGCGMVWGWDKDTFQLHRCPDCCDIVEQESDTLKCLGCGSQWKWSNGKLEPVNGGSAFPPNLTPTTQSWDADDRGQKSYTTSHSYQR